MFHSLHTSDIKAAPSELSYPYHYRPHTLLVQARDKVLSHLKAKGIHAPGHLIALLIVRDRKGHLGFIAANDQIPLADPYFVESFFQRLILNAGAGFVVATTGAIMRMPGLPKSPAALRIDVVDGKIVGLS